MATASSSFRVSTKGFSDVLDLTRQVQRAVEQSAISSGIVTVFVLGSTAGITTIEFESGAVEDLKRTIRNLVPEGERYAHDARWGDGNGFSHVRAALMGPSLTVPFTDGRLQAGTWQQIVLVDFDNRPRARDILITITGS